MAGTRRGQRSGPVPGTFTVEFRFENLLEGDPPRPYLVEASCAILPEVGEYIELRDRGTAGKGGVVKSIRHHIEQLDAGGDRVYPVIVVGAPEQRTVGGF